MKALLLLTAIAIRLTAAEGWWMREPIRWLQTNIRETDDTVDAVRLAGQLAEFRANVLLFGMGGIVAHYPTDLPYHYRSAYMPPGRDPFGEVLAECHKRGIRVVGRFDFSKTPKPVFDAHPEWFFRMSSGQPVVYNQLYSTCINGGYYRVHAMKILAEALDRYEVDGLFFNMFGNQSSAYSGRKVGLCHCDTCRRLFRERYRRELPESPDAEYEQFMFASSREVAAEIGKLIRAKRPEAGYFNYIQQSTDGIMSESNTAVRRPLPLWPYASSDNVNRARNSEPSKMAVNLCMSFIDFPWRFANVPGPEIALRLWQNVAHGGAAAMNMHGLMDQQDRHAIDAARPVYQWLAANQQYYAGQRSLARVLLLGKPPAGREYSQTQYRGLFRLLSEQHIPFALADNMEWLARGEKFDLVIAVNHAPAALDGYVRGGGSLLVATSRPPEIPMPPVARRWKAVEGYFRIQSPDLFPSLRQTRLLMLNGDYTEYAASGVSKPPLTLVPPSMYGPPEKVHVDQTDTDKPGLILENRGKGKIAVLPWDIGTLYYLHSSESHAGLLADLIDRLLPGGRQIRTNAHALVEMTLMGQGGRTLLHLVNLSGHSQTGYFAPIPMSGIGVEVAGGWATARLLRSAEAIPVTRSAGYAGFTVPVLRDYEVVVLD
jgi:hypothetical protein